MQTLVDMITKRLLRPTLIASLALLTGALVCRGQSIDPKPAASGPTQRA